MKRKYVFVLVLCTIGLAAPATFAKGKKNKNAPPPTVPSDVYAKYDINSNGILDADEKKALLEDFAKDPKGVLLATYDTNADGKLSDDEVAAIPATKVSDAAPTKKKHKKNK